MSPPTNVRQTTIPKNDYRSVPVPAPDATDEALAAYRTQANRRGATISPTDLEEYRDLIGDLSGERVLIGAQSDPKFSKGLQQLGAAFAVQHPEAIHRAREAQAFAEFNTADNQADHFPERLRHLDPDVVTANPEEFARRQRLVNDLPVMPAQPTSAQFKATREALEGIGLRLTTYEQYAYKAVSEGTFSSKKIPLAVEALNELKLPKGERQLLNMQPAEFAEALRTRQPLPKEQPRDLADERLSEREPDRTSHAHEYSFDPLPSNESPYSRTPNAPQQDDEPSRIVGTELVGEHLRASNGGKEEQTTTEAQRVQIRRGERTYAIEGGEYKQRGRILGVRDGEIFQQIAGAEGEDLADDDVVAYKLSDIDTKMTPRDFNLAVKAGHTCEFRASAQGRIEMTDLDLRKELGRPQQRSMAPQRAERKLQIGSPTSMEL
jgi:hypothetical protein